VALREDQIQRYARHVLLPEVGGRGQERLLAGAVAVAVGPGRDAEVAALAYLAAAGVGRLVLRGEPGGALTAAEVKGGILYGAGDAGRVRLDALRARVAAINPDVEVVAGGAPDVAVDVDIDLEEEMDPAADEDAGAGAVAGALVRGGAAATRVLLRLATGVRMEPAAP